MKYFNLSSFSVKESEITFFLIVVLILSGSYSFLSLGRSEDPSFSFKMMSISAEWPGATALEMQEQVASVLEKRLQELEYYDRVETVSRPGSVLMTLFFKDSIDPELLPQQFYQVRKKIIDETNALPKNIKGPFIDDEFSDLYFSLYAFKSKLRPYAELVKEAEKVRQKLQQVEGVAKVKLIGEHSEKIYVDISSQYLASIGVSHQDVFDALRLHNDLSPSGFVETNGPRVYIRLSHAKESVEMVKSISINVGGRLIKLGDIAKITRGYQYPPSFQVLHQGDDSLILGLIMKPDYNGLILGESLKVAEIDIYKSIPEGITLSKISDQSKIISDAVNEFMIKFVVALIVVMVVSFVSLGFRVGLVVAASVPLTLGTVFIVMLVTGFGFDRITLGALIISLGLLVDDIMISIEMMVVKMEEGYPRLKAAAFAWSSTAAPMLAGTLVTILGFLPIGFAQSSSGEYAGNIFWIVGISLIASWFVSVYFTPYIGFKILPDLKSIEGGSEAIYSTRNYQYFRRLVQWCVDHKYIVTTVTIFAFILACIGLMAVTKQFFPKTDRPELTVHITLPEGTAFNVTRGVTERIEREIRQYEEAGVVTSYIGQGAPRFFMSQNLEHSNSSYAQIIILTKGGEDRDRLKEKVNKMIIDGVAPEARIRLTQFAFGPPTPYPLKFRVIGDDINTISHIALQVKSVMEKNPNVVSPHLDWLNKASNIQLKFDHDRLKLIGITPLDASQQLDILLNGYTATQIREDARIVDVVVRGTKIERRSLGLLNDLSLMTSDGVAVPLSQVAKIIPSTEDSVLKRYDRELYISIQSDVVAGFQPPDVAKQIFDELTEIRSTLPKGYSIEVGGIVEESNKANASLAKLLPIMVILTLTVIMFQVRSFSATFVVFATAPLGLIGAVPTMLIFDQPFGFTAILALIALAGILMRNTLILVDWIKHEKHTGKSDYEAIIESTVHRVRPVALTSVATMMAFIPLTQSSFWGSMAYVLIGGVGIGTILTLLFLPAFYAVCFRVSSEKVVGSNNISEIA